MTTWSAARKNETSLVEAAVESYHLAHSRRHTSLHVVGKNTIAEEPDA